MFVCFLFPFFATKDRDLGEAMNRAEHDAFLCISLTGVLSPESLKSLGQAYGFVGIAFIFAVLIPGGLVSFD